MSLKYYIFFYICFIISCSTNNNGNNKVYKKKVIATLNGKNIFVNQVDTIIEFDMYEQRLNALKLYVSKKILENEAQKNNITLEQLVNNQINNKCKNVTTKDLEEYISQSGISNFDTNNIMSYLLTIKRKNRQTVFIDSLKQYYSLKIKLQPPFYKKINTENIISNSLSKNKSTIEVLIISDFNCYSCQKAEKSLKKLYNKYNKVHFKFVYFSGYIDKSAIACEAAMNQNKFRQMHDKIFENVEKLHLDSVYFSFAKDLNLDLNEFANDMNDNTILKKLIERKEYLISNNIVYSTPTFIVNGKILDDKYAIDYLEDVIKEELTNK